MNSIFLETDELIQDEIDQVPEENVGNTLCMTCKFMIKQLEHKLKSKSNKVRRMIAEILNRKLFNIFPLN